MSNNENIKVIDILLVEDNPGDIRLTKEALKDSKVYNNLFVARDGEEAINILTNKAPYEEQAKPDLILLDLNLPKVSGIEVLHFIKSNDNLKSIPVVILSTSKAEEDILKSYKLHANCYITKPVDLEQFMNVVDSIEGFWLTIVKLPPEK